MTAGYSGTPLAKKLGIREDDDLMVIADGALTAAGLRRVAESLTQQQAVVLLLGVGRTAHGHRS